MNTNVVLLQVLTNATQQARAATNWADTITPYNDVVKAWGPILIGLITIIVTFLIQLVLLRHQRRQFERQLEAANQQVEVSRSKEEREEILQRLSSFYGPLKELRTQSRTLYRKLAPEIQARYANNNNDFRTLRYLLDGNSFTGQDAQILLQIDALNGEILKLIETQSGLVDKPQLQELLGRLATHIRLLKLACAGKLTGPSALYDDIVFPREIDGAIESATLRMQDRMKELLHATTPEKDRDRLPAKNATIRFYDSNADRYAQDSKKYDLSDPYRRFIRSLPPTARVGGRLLDAGCGSGRDTRYFIEQGFRVVSFDASIEMVRKCREYPHAYCLHRYFDEVDFKEDFDGVWACASLLHLDRDEARRALARLTTSLRPDGVMFVSVKQGAGQRTLHGRHFEYYSSEDAQALFATDRRLSLLENWVSTSESSDGCEQVSWLNLLLRRNT